MKKMKKELVSAIEYSKQNPTISNTKVSELFNVDRHSLAKYKKDDLYLNFKFENISDQNDKFLYWFDKEELDFIETYLANPTVSYNTLRAKNPNAPERRALYRYL